MPVSLSSSLTETQVEGKITPTVERKFESNLTRLFTSQEGHSQARTWAVRILSLALVLPVVLTAILDAGRALGFLAGNKSETLGKVFTGKSFSLIDEMSTAGQAVTNKVNAAYRSITKPTVLTKEELNKRTEKALQSQANRLIDGYKALNGGYFHTNSSFSSPSALKGEKQIRAAQSQMDQLIGGYVIRNASNTEEFNTAFAAIRDKVDNLITVAAKDDVFVANKVVRKGPQPLLADVAVNEFNAFSKKTGAISCQFIALAKQEPDLAKSLKLGIDQEIITKQEAREVVAEQAPVVFNRALTSGLDAANAAEKALLDSAVANQIITQAEAGSISRNEGLNPESNFDFNSAFAKANDFFNNNGAGAPSDIASIANEGFSEASSARPNGALTVEQLATAAALDVVKQKTSNTTEEIVKAQLTEAADQLIANQKLDPKDKSEFLTLAYSQIGPVAEAVEANLQSQRAIQEQTEVVERQAAVLAEAQRSAEMARADAQRAQETQKTEAQTKLVGDFKDLLSVIAKKQAGLNDQFVIRDQLEAERHEMTNELSDIRRTGVIINNKLMSILDAAPIYYKEKGRISDSKSKTDKQKDESAKALAAQGFDQKAVDMINRLAPLDKQLDKKIEELAVVSERIESQHREIGHLIDVYGHYKKHNKKLLIETNRKQVKSSEREVFDVQNGLNTKRNKVLHVGMVDQLRPHVSTASPDPVMNAAEVASIIEADRAAQFSESTGPATLPNTSAPNGEEEAVLPQPPNATGGLLSMLYSVPGSVMGIPGAIKRKVWG